MTFFLDYHRALQNRFTQSWNRTIIS